MHRALVESEQAAASSLEVIVVDDHSTDRSTDLTAVEFPWVRLVRLPQNIGFAGACHEGAKAARGEYLLFLNNDAWPDRTGILKLIGYLKDHHETSGLALKILNVDGSFQGGPAGLDWLGFPGGVRHNRELFFAFGAAFVVKRDAYFDVDGLDQSYFAFSEEVDLFWRLHLRGHQIGYCEEAKFYHLGGQSFGEGSRLTKVTYRRFSLGRRNALKTLLKNYSSCILPVVLLLWILETTAEIGMSLVVTRQFTVAKADLWAVLDVIRDRKGWMERRRRVQRRRKVSDRLIMQRMLPPFERTRFALRRAFKS